ncbi:MAG TPA: hypothetical protein EYP14_19520, partial [Planctomycetaceae bacterium]|nr:hypothetical protein [Planctomycetaceae bacterium]
MEHVKVFCFFASYVVALVCECTRLLGRATFGRVLAAASAAAGFVAHTSYLWYRAATSELPPLLSSTQDWFLVLAWIAILVYLFFLAVDRRTAIGLFLLPLVVALIGAAYFVSTDTNVLIRGEETRRTAMHNWALLHASLTVFGIAGVLLGIVLSLMYLVQHRRLKRKQVLGTGLALPSLATLARWNRWAVIVSVPLLTLGLCSGVLLGLGTRKTETPVTFVDPFVIGVGLTWAVMFAFFLWLLRRQAPTSRRVAWLTVWAFGSMLVTMISLQILIRGWIH